MFTGIVEEIGIIKNIRRGTKSSVLTIEGEVIFDDLKLGDSVAVNGVCLTVTTINKNTITADVMFETLNRSSLGTLNIGSKVNLERAMSANGRFGGHIVSGHIDGTGKIINKKKVDNAILYYVSADKKILNLIIEKGSIAIDGISLTIVEITNSYFSVSIIPHTLSNTILTQKNIGDIVNLENDCIGKYVKKLLSTEEKSSNITEELLIKNGF